MLYKETATCSDAAHIRSQMSKRDDCPALVHYGTNDLTPRRKLESMPIGRPKWHILAYNGCVSFSNEAVMGKCPEYDRLHGEVEGIFGNLAQVTTLLLELFRSKDLAGVHRLDKELELTVGEKERTLGALRQHVKEHKCVEPL